MKFSAMQSKFRAIDARAIAPRELYSIYGDRKIKDDGRCKGGEKGYRRTMNGSKTNTEFLYLQRSLDEGI